MGDGFVTLVLNDGGTAVQVPQSAVQVKIGCASGGVVPAATPYATNSPASLVTNSGSGPMTESAAMSIAKGATIIAIRAAIANPGTATPPVLTQGTGASLGTVGANGVTLTLDASKPDGSSGVAIGAHDTFYVQVNVVGTGSVGTGSTGAGPTIQISLDAGRNFGPQITLPTAATTYVIPNTGITLDFATAGTMVVGNVLRFCTQEPTPNVAGIQACLTALKASTFASGGWGSMHIISGVVGTLLGTGRTVDGLHSGADVQTVNGYIDQAAAPAFFTNGLYTRCFFDARDASPPVVWGGTGETEATWMASLQGDFSAESATRVCDGAGWYNMPSAIGAGLGQGGSVVGSPSYRRPGTWAAAARRVQTQPQRLISRVRDQALDNIVLNPLTDPTDGFIYHDERSNPGLDSLISGAGTNRFMAFMTRPNKTGFFVSNPNLMSPPGSQYTLLPYGDVIDVFCGLLNAKGTEEINDDVRLTPAYTLNPNDAVTIQNDIKDACDQAMTAKGMCSSLEVVVDQTHVVGGPSGDSKVPITGTCKFKGYILAETITVNAM